MTERRRAGSRSLRTSPDPGQCVLGLCEQSGHELGRGEDVVDECDGLSGEGQELVPAASTNGGEQLRSDGRGIDAVGIMCELVDEGRAEAPRCHRLSELRQGERRHHPLGVGHLDGVDVGRPADALLPIRMVRHLRGGEEPGAKAGALGAEYVWAVRRPSPRGSTSTTRRVSDVRLITVVRAPRVGGRAVPRQGGRRGAHTSYGPRAAA